MADHYNNYSVRNLASHSKERIVLICEATRLPAGAVLEDAIDLLWDSLEMDQLNGAE